MKLRKKISLISLIILLTYNAIMFLIPTARNITFWIAYGFCNLSIIITGLIFLGQLDDEDIKKKFNNMPVIYMARAYLILQLVMGFVEIFYPINSRYSILINVILLGLSIIGIIIVSTGKKEIERVDTKVQEKVFFIKEILSEIELYENKTTDETAKKELGLLIETIKYSDPMSHSKLATIENQISIKVEKLIKTDDTESIKELCYELQQDFAERNKKVKLYKNQPEQKNEQQKPINFKAIIAGIVSILVVIAISLTVYYTVIIPNNEYNEAMNLYNSGQYLQAEEAFKALGDYKDSKQKQFEVIYIYANNLLESKDYLNAEKEFNKIIEYKDSNEKINESIYLYANQLFKEKDYTNAAEQFLRLENYKDSKDKVIEIYNLFGESDIVYFGKYNEKPIAWQILDTREHKVLLITKEPIDEMAFNKEFKAISWKESTIRQWLNNEFYNCFDEVEKSKLLKNTQEIDDVFLLSNEDIKSYEKLRNTNTTWWIATNGDENTKAMFVNEDGTINENGDIVTKLHGVRPAIWLSLD